MSRIKETIKNMKGGWIVHMIDNEQFAMSFNDYQMYGWSLKRAIPWAEIVKYEKLGDDLV